MSATPAKVPKQGGSTRENVKVVCRVRPTNSRELKEGSAAMQTCVKCSLDRLDLEHADTGAAAFSFDRVFGQDSTQIQVFEYSAIPLIADVLDGYNATIFAYGQTGAGKTHTMEGDIYNVDLKGIIPRSVDALFEGVTQADSNIEFTFKVSYIEIYKEKIRDLLDNSQTRNNLAIREDKLLGIHVAGVIEEYVTSTEDLFKIMSRGSLNRAVAATGMNEGSSRSHSVFTITVSQKNEQTKLFKMGKLVLVDLAGSEMVKKSDASGQQLEEAKTINKSLSALGQVINALTSEDKSHVPYRDSKLTRILQDSLGGNSKTCLIIAISPAAFNARETISTLRFGMRAKNINNSVTQNAVRSYEEVEQLLDQAEKLIETQTQTIESQATQIMSLKVQFEEQAAQITQFENSGAPKAALSSPPLPSLPMPPPTVGQVPSASAKEIEDLRKAAVETKKTVEEMRKTNAELARKLDAAILEIAEKDGELKDLTNHVIGMNVEVRDLNSHIEELNEMMVEANEALQILEQDNDRLQQENDDLQRDVDLAKREKSDIAAELETLQSTHKSSIDSIQYASEEKDLTIQRYIKENQMYKDEISQLSGDNFQGSKDINAASRNKELEDAGSQSSASVTEDKDSRSSIDRTNTGQRITVERTTREYEARLKVAREGSSDYQASTDNELPYTFDNFVVDKGEFDLDAIREKFESWALVHRVDALVKDQIWPLFEIMFAEHQFSILDWKSKTETADKLRVEGTRKLKEREIALMKFDQTLRLKMEEIAQFKIHFDMIKALGLDTSLSQEPELKNFFEQLDAKEHQSLQQRLEQLVAVHRQLLRKYANMELDASELKSKLELRDKRILQVERALEAQRKTSQAQTDSHILEVTRILEQFRLLRAEQAKERASSSNVQHATNSVSAISSLQQMRNARTEEEFKELGLASSSFSAHPNVKRSVRGGGVVGAGAGSGGGGSGVEHGWIEIGSPEKKTIKGGGGGGILRGPDIHTSSSAEPANISNAGSEGNLDSNKKGIFGGFFNSN